LGRPIVTSGDFVAQFCDSDALFPNYFGEDLLFFLQYIPIHHITRPSTNSLHAYPSLDFKGVLLTTFKPVLNITLKILSHRIRCIAPQCGAVAAFTSDALPNALHCTAATRGAVSSVKEP